MENNQTTMDIYYNLLEESVSNIVHVFCNQEGIRNSFCTGFSICGKLEKHKDLDSYRVVLALGTYVYFTSKDIVWVIKHFEYFQDGSKYSIRIQIDSQLPVAQTHEEKLLDE